MNLPIARTFAGLMDEMAQRYPQRRCLTDQRRTLSYSEFRTEVRGAAKGLHALGVRRGDQVALLIGNQAEWLVVNFAVAMLGARVVALNTWWKQSELQHALTSTGTSLLVMVDSYLGNDYAEALQAMGDRRLALPRLRQIVGWGDKLPSDALCWQDLLLQGESVPDQAIDAAQAAVQPDDTAYLLFTSGSTARSKAVQLTHRGNIENGHAIGERMHLSEQDRVLIPTSMFWSFSCVNALFAAMTHGGSLVIMFKYDTAELLRLVEAERCTAVYTLPNIALALYTHPDRYTRDLSSWRTGICRSSLVGQMAQLGATEMITGYGLTECYGHSVDTDCRDPLEHRMQCCGRPLANVELKIVNPANGSQLPAGESGEICLRGHVTPGYFNDPERTRESIDDAGWFHTGDLGVLDDGGFLQFKGRLKELIKTGGINVSPADVEEVLLSHPDVQQVVVVGLPDAAREEIVAAMVVARPNVVLDRQVLLAHCRHTAASFKVPRFLVVVNAEDVPLTDTGKVHRGRTTELMAQRYAAEGLETSRHG